MPFENLLGNQFQKEILLNTVRKNRICHSYIFSGVDGIGKKLFALEFAKLANCTNKDKFPNLSQIQSDKVTDPTEGNVIGKCNCLSCSKIEKGVHPDVTLLDYKNEKTIKIDNIKTDVEKKIYLRPFESHYKIFIIDNAERMNSNAQNAFLKTLEEPPKFCIIILITNSLSFIVTTIKSRCQIINFNSIRSEVIAEKIREPGDLNEQESRIASKIANGSIVKAIRIDREYLDFRKNIIQKLMKVDYGKPSEIFELCEYMGINSKDGIEHHRLLFDLISLWIQDLLLVKLNYSREQVINSDVYANMLEYVRYRSMDNLLTKADQLEDSWYGLSRLNVNKRIAYEDLILKLSV